MSIDDQVITIADIDDARGYIPAGTIGRIIDLDCPDDGYPCWFTIQMSDGTILQFDTTEEDKTIEYHPG